MERCTVRLPIDSQWAGNGTNRCEFTNSFTTGGCAGRVRTGGRAGWGGTGFVMDDGNSIGSYHCCCTRTQERGHVPVRTRCNSSTFSSFLLRLHNSLSFFSSICCPSVVCIFRVPKCHTRSLCNIYTIYIIFIYSCTLCMCQVKFPPTVSNYIIKSLY